MAKGGFKSAAQQGRRTTKSKSDLDKKKAAVEKVTVTARVPSGVVEEVRTISHARKFEGHRGENLSSIIAAALVEYRDRHKAYLKKKVR